MCVYSGDELRSLLQRRLAAYGTPQDDAEGAGRLELRRLQALARADGFAGRSLPVRFRDDLDAAPHDPRCDGVAYGETALAKPNIETIWEPNLQAARAVTC